MSESAIMEALDSVEPPQETPATDDAGEDTGLIVEGQEDPAAEPEAEPEAKPEPVKLKPASLDQDELFTDEALATPDALRAARELIQEQRRTSHRKYLELSKREDRFKREKGEVFKARDNLRAQYGLLQNDLQALRTGDADTVLQALSRVTGKPAPELFEEISINLARNGKKAAPSAEVLELRQELGAMREHLQSKEMAQQQQALTSEIEDHKSHIAKLASDATAYPVLASFAADNPRGVANDVSQYILDQYRAGVQLDYETALSHIESQLQERFQRVQVVPRIAESGRETGAAKPVSVPQVGRTLTPSLSTQSMGQSRPATEQELLKKAAQELPQGFWQQFGME